jgi:hypothetical protein
MITPRNKDLVGKGSPDVWTGSTVGAHGFEDPNVNADHLRRCEQYIASRGEFGWGNFIR